jgi:mRNA interferase MazF
VRPIHIAQLDKARPVLVLTRELVRPQLSWVTVAPITSTVRSLSTKSRWESQRARSGLGRKLRQRRNVPTSTLGPLVGYLLPWQGAKLADAIRAAFDLM